MYSERKNRINKIDIMKKEKIQKMLRLLGIIMLIAALFVTVLCFPVFAQGVGISDTGKIDPHKAAILELRSETKGLLIPRMTSQQRLYIPVNALSVGVAIYQTDGESGLYFYDGKAWRRLIVSDEIGGDVGQIPNLAKVATTGDFDDLIDKPLIPTHLSQLEQDSLYFTTVSAAEQQRWDTAALGENIFSGDYKDLQDKPAIPTQLKQMITDSMHLLVTAAERESWNNKADKEDIPTHLSQLEQDNNYYTTISKEERDMWNAAVKSTSFSGKYSDLENLPVLALVALTGDYRDLKDSPSFNLNLDLDSSQLAALAAVAITGSYKDLVNTPIAKDSTGEVLTIAKVATTGNYEDVINKPTIPTQLKQMLTDSMHLLVTANERESWNNKAYKEDIPTKLSQLEQDENYRRLVKKSNIAEWDAIDTNNFDGEYISLKGKPVFAAVAYSGAYEDLKDEPGRTELAEMLGLQQVALNGEYSSLNNPPAIKTKLSDFVDGTDSRHRIMTTDDYNAYNTAVMGFNTHKNHFIFDGNYLNLVNSPDLQPVALSGEYKDLKNKPSAQDFYDLLALSPVAYSGAYNNLVQKPTKDQLKKILNLPDIVYTGNYYKTGQENLPDFVDQAPHPSITPATDVKIENTLKNINYAYTGTNTSAYARADHVHYMANESPEINFSTDVHSGNVTTMKKAVNAAYIKFLFSTDNGAIGNTVSGNSYGDVVANGFNSDAGGFELKIRNQGVEFTNARVTDIPVLNNNDFNENHEDARRIAAMKNLSDYLAEKSKQLSDTLTKKYLNSSVSKTELNNLVPAGAVVMYDGNNISAVQQSGCWEVLTEMNQRIPVGAIQSYQGVSGTYMLNATGGAEKVTLTYMPYHTHSIRYRFDDDGGIDGNEMTHVRSNEGSGYSYSQRTEKTVWGTDYSISDNSFIENIDNGTYKKTPTAHENMPPYRAVYFIKRTNKECK
jgi:microcystin-dependent protein